MIRIGSLCSGYGGLDLAVMSVIGGSVAWHAESEADPSAILARRWAVPNFGDITTVDWSTVPTVDWLTAGYPCQPFSHAGKRKGSDDERHLWPYVAAAIGALRPRHILLENVAGHVSLGLADVVGDLAALGYDATWTVVRAADAGAPHGRARLFLLADAQGEPGCEWDGDDVRAGRAADGPGATARGSAATDPGGETVRLGTGLREAEPERFGRGRPNDNGSPLSAADPTGDGRDERRAEPAGVERGSDASERGHVAPHAHDTDGRGSHTQRRTLRRDAAASGGDSRIEWGAYGDAIRRWEAIAGRLAPSPTEHGRTGQRLSPRFVEWMMGLADGWVTDIDIPRNAQLKALGNGVVPQQAALALRTLLPLCEVAA